LTAAAPSTAGALWALSRPRLWPYVMLLVFAGYGWGHWDRALSLKGWPDILWVFGAWTALNAGTLWINAALDRDEGEVLMGASVPVPPGIALYGYGALVLAVLLLLPVGGTALACVAASAVLAVLYSHPATVWKGHPIGGPFVNVVGYGLLSPLAGWSVVGVSTNPRTLVMWGLMGLAVLGTFLLAQAFQEEEDAERGYRTFVAVYGPRATLQAARACIAAGILGGMTLAAVGWIPRVCLLGLPLVLWLDSWLRTWADQPGGGGEQWARGAARRLLITTLVGFGLASAEYIRESYSGVPVAGLGTAAGHPSDRPCLPPRELAQWEREQRRSRTR
jgi:4-hydroxybenzoate polyprenyltransferase